jgi:hypothetical protein
MTLAIFSAGSSAVISPCRQYRYRLERRWGEGPLLLFMMLNPSVAAAFTDDPTIRKCVGFAQRMGRAGIVVVNLFGFRATDPRKLWEPIDPVGPENDRHILAAWSDAGRAGIMAWGAFDKPIVRRRVEAVTAMLARDGGRMQCLGRAANGQPRHPLMLAYATPLEEYRCPP